MEIQTLIFDFGNVLGFFNHRLTTQKLARYTDLPADALHALLFGGQLEDDYEAGRISTSAFLQKVRATCQLRCDDATVAAAWADIFRPNQEMCALVPRLKPHYRLMLASNTNELHCQHYRRQFAGVLGHFDALVFSHEVGARKPLAAFFEHCQQWAGCDPRACLFIDDMPANVEGARAYGWNGIVYKDFADLQIELAAQGIDCAKSLSG